MIQKTEKIMIQIYYVTYFFLRKSYLCEIQYIDYKIMTCLENLIKILKVNQCFIHLLF